jgi:hypothetical protein
VVTSQKEQKELEELKRKITEYIIAMRIELERKRLVSAVTIYIYHYSIFFRAPLTTRG